MKFYNIMDYQYKKRKTGKDKERRNREINGKFSAKHIRIQDQCQENHMKNIHDEKNSKLDNNTSNVAKQKHKKKK